nr:NYN domain-containing protein [Kiloniellales bacterium]
FVIISGDSDFSPLVSKLRENDKTVIGVGVKNSTSDLLMNNCDEFIFYDDLVRASASTKSRGRRPAKKKSATEKKPDKKAEKKEAAGKNGDRQDEAIDLVLETAEALLAERGDPVWGSMIKQTLKRRRPGFSETFYGFQSFSDLLEEAEDRGFLHLEPDERSGGYVVRSLRRGD